MSRKFSLAALALATTALVPLSAHADEAAPAPSGSATVEEIIVTARRRDERLVDTPVAITAMSGDRLADYGVTDFSDISSQVPSMVAGRAASGSSASIFLRGVGSTALSAGFDQSVSFIVDGLPMSRGREISLSQYDVQRIEVLKGPQALFYGKNTTGGLISVVTNGPTRTFEAGFKAGYGFEAQEIYGEGYVSGPITDTLRARLAVRLSDAEGAFDNTAAKTYTDPLGMERHRTSEHRGFGTTRSGRLTIAWDPTDNFDLELKVGATSQEDGGPTDVLERICGGGRTTPASANGIPPSPNADCKIDGRADASDLPREVAETMRYARDGSMYADLTSSFAVLTGNLSFDKVDVNSITSFYQFEQSDLNNVAGEAYPASFSQFTKFEQLAQEIRFQTKFDGPVNFMFGGFASKSEFTFNTDAYIFPVPLDPITGTYVTFRRDDGFEAQSLSFFVEGTYALAENWEASLGARWSREERDSYQRSLPGHSAFAGAFPANIDLEDEYSEENVSPQATIRWKPSRDVSVYASYKEGFKSGGFNISQSLTPAASVAAGEFGGETARGFEVGVRSILLGGGLSLNATIYDYLYEDLQVQSFDPVTIGQVAANAGELRTRGAEADFEWLPRAVEGLSLRGAIAYNSAEYDDYVGQCYSGQTIAQGCNLILSAGAYTSQDYSGQTPPKAPEWAGRIGATYEVAVGDSMSLQFLADVSYTSEYNFTDTLRPDAVQDAYTKFDASIRLNGPDDRWTLALIGRNLTEEFVVTSANDIPFTGGTGTGTTVGVVSDMSAFVENPREITLEFSMKF
ncbi:MAG: TonB-dependent receptor [Caulobacter sp.]|nr:TonB-dependent receptor [Caulobacter sp.]